MKNKKKIAGDYYSLEGDPTAELKKDFCCILEFQKSVEYYTQETLSIEYEYNGTTNFYIPDFLVKIDRQKNKEYLLAEIKFRDEIRNNWPVLKPAYKAAKKYAETRGWIFKIYSEDEIRIESYLQNIKFLLRYKEGINLPYLTDKGILLRIIEAVKITSPEEIILIAFGDRHRRAEIIPTLWYLLANGLVGFNHFDKLTMSSEIWCVTD